MRTILAIAFGIYLGRELHNKNSKSEKMRLMRHLQKILQQHGLTQTEARKQAKKVVNEVYPI